MSLALKLASFCLLLLAGCATTPTTIYLVRHAEKAKSEGRDPDLTKVGEQRAKDLSLLLRSTPLTAIYTTRWVRTKKTAAPTAAMTGIAPQVIDSTPELLKRLKADHDKPRHVLVVGHSNTVPDILSGLGVDRVVSLASADYDNVFVVRIAGEDVSMLHLHFGERAGK